MKGKVFDLLVAVVFSLIILAVIALIASGFVLVVNLLGRWALLLLVFIFTLLVWWIYRGLSSKEGDSDE